MTWASRNGAARPYLPFAPDLPPTELEPPHTEAITSETYVYDAHGHRTRSSRSDGSTRYQVYSRAGQLLYTEDSRNTNTGEYDWQRSDWRFRFMRSQHSGTMGSHDSGA